MVPNLHRAAQAMGYKQKDIKKLLLYNRKHYSYITKEIVQAWNEGVVAVVVKG